MGSAFGAGSLMQQILSRDHSFSTYAKFSKKLTFLTNVSFSENFAYVLNE